MSLQDAEASPKRSGIGAIPIADVKSSVQQAIEQAARQRQVLADTAQKQALGLYPNTGTSAAAYNYLRGAPGAKYPVNPILAGQPGSALESSTVSKPYEGATKVGTPTQTEISKTAKDTPTKMPTVSYGPRAVQQPGLLGSLLDLALPAYLGYKGYQYLSGLPAAAGAAGSITGVGGLPMIVQDPFGYVEPAAAETVSGIQSYLDAGASGGGGGWFGGGLDDVVQQGSRAITERAATLPTLSAEAGEVGYILQDGALVPATAEQIAAASSSGAYVTTPGDLISSSFTADTGAAAGAEGFGAMASQYGPYIAAAIIADQLTGGQLGKGVQDVISNLGKAGQSVIDTATGALEDLGGGAKEIVNNVLGFAGIRLAKGGAVKGIPALLPRRFDAGGETEAPDNPLIPRFADTNALGRVLDSDLVTQYDKATKAGNISKAKALKGEIDYRNRMRSTQTTPMASGGLSAIHYNLGGYSDGGRLLKGPGDGVSDDIPAVIGNKQPARLADGEFVVPARIVSELGNGSTDAGARKLYAMMDRIQNARKKSVGKGKVAVNSRADKNLPA